MEVRRAKLIDPKTGQELPGWVDKAKHYLQSRTMRWLFAAVAAFLGSKIGAEFAPDDIAHMMDQLCVIVEKAGVLFGIYYTARRRWQPPVIAEPEPKKQRGGDTV